MKGRKVLAVLLLAAVLLGAMSGVAALADGYVTATTGDTNIRSGPGLSYSKLGVLYKGNSLEYLDGISYDGRGVAWYKVAYGYGSGWVSSRYTDLYDYDYDYYDYDYYDYDWDIAVEATGRVNVRTGPGTSYDDMGTLISGERVEYLGSTSYDNRGIAWYKVRFYSNGDGWVSSRNSKLVYGQPGGGETGRRTYSGDYVEATGRLNIRSGPGLSYADRGTMLKGDVAYYLNDYSVDERGVTWYKVSFGNVTGWVSSRYSKLY